MGELFKVIALGRGIDEPLVGFTAGLGMFFYSTMQSSPESALKLSAIVFLAMTCSCFLSSVSGVMVPLTLKKLGFDPATASSIFLTTATDVATVDESTVWKNLMPLRRRLATTATGTARAVRNGGGDPRSKTKRWPQRRRG